MKLIPFFLLFYPRNKQKMFPVANIWVIILYFTQVFSYVKDPFALDILKTIPFQTKLVQKNVDDFATPAYTTYYYSPHNYLHCHTQVSISFALHITTQVSMQYSSTFYARVHDFLYGITHLFLRIHMVTDLPGTKIN